MQKYQMFNGVVMRNQENEGSAVGATRTELRRVKT
jgi:hypothetical protein